MNAIIPTTLYSRQPILDKDLEVFAYEIKYRSDDKCPTIYNAERMSAETILNAYTELPIENLLEGKRGFLYLSSQIFKMPPPVSSDQLIIGISNNTDIDNDLINIVKQLKENGFLISLTNSFSGENQHELFKLADIIKLDVSDQSPQELRRKIYPLSNYKTQLLAENIETKEQYLQCQKLDFSLFQGRFISTPYVVRGKKLGVDQKAVLNLLCVLQDPNTEFEEIESVIATSSVLTYKLLRLSNSPSLSLQVHVDSVHKALVILGMDKVRTWGSLLALTLMPSKPKILCSNALIRGRMCRLLAELFLVDEVRGDSLFTAGLLSTIDLFLDLPMKTLINSLRLPPWLKDTLLEHKGNMGLILHTAVCYEKGYFHDVDWNRLREFGVNRDAVQSAYHDSILWAADLMEQFG